MEIIILLIIIALISKYILFHARISSIVFGISSIALFCCKPEWFSKTGASAPAILLAIYIIDCIRDICAYEKYYASLSKKIDKLFAIKSISTICCMAFGWFCLEQNLTLGFIPRIVYLVAVYPIQYIDVYNDVHRRIKEWEPIPYISRFYDMPVNKCYWYKKVVDSLSKNGKIVSNVEVVKNEFDISIEKLEKNYPQKLFKKILVSIFDKEKQANHDNWRKQLQNSEKNKQMAYINTGHYSELEKRLVQVLTAKKSVYSPNVIKNFAELNDMNLNYENGIFKDTIWSEHFIIKALSESVKAGKINDYQCNDEPLDNHSYGIIISSQIASDNPLLALDD